MRIIIIANPGADPSETMAHVRIAPSGRGFDVRNAEVMDIKAVGILEAASVAQAALLGAGSIAALALPMGVLVHRKQRKGDPSAP